MKDEKTFKALSDSGRRRMLDIIKEFPGINVNELAENFDYTRFAVMKHLKILEEAGLVVPQKEGKNKKLYLNAVPIQMIYDRWISKYSAYWATKLNSIKYKLEQEENMGSSDIKQVFVTYIKSSKEKVWNALTDGSITEQYYYGTKIKSDFIEGSKIEYIGTDKDGNEYTPVFGKIVKFNPTNVFSHTFNMLGSEETDTLAEYTLTEEKGVVKLSLIHSGFAEESELFKNVGGGWPLIFSGLKTLLETGSPML